MKHRKTPPVKNSMSKLDYRNQPQGPGLVTTGDGAEVRTWGTRGDTPQCTGYWAANVAVVLLVVPLLQDPHLVARLGGAAWSATMVGGASQP